MKKQTLFALICLSLFATTLFAQANPSADEANAQTPSAIPEEARKHSVKGTTLFSMGTELVKNAKTPADLSEAENDLKQAAGEFKQAADLAPQWPDPRWNLALAKEATGDYSGAIADLKLYQKFKLSEKEARTVQDKIYALEAKAEVAGKKQKQVDDLTAAAAAATHAEQVRYGWLEAEWSYESEYQGWGPNYGAARGVAQSKRINNVVEIGPINNYSGPLGELFATVDESGDTSWYFNFVPTHVCSSSRNPNRVSLTVGQDKHTIHFQVDSYSGANCNFNLPFIVTLTRR
jgi:tetratricopeptide (TPR) repeat protein